MKKLILGLVLSMLASVAKPGELVISGTYHGKDIYVQNPYDPGTQQFCTQMVFVNDRQVFDQPNVSAYKIDLSDLAINDEVYIRIVHSDGCKPRIVNPQVLKSLSDFEFLTIETDNNSLNWSTKGEAGSGNFFIEQKTVETNWQVIDTVASKGEPSNLYTAAAPHQKGENTYRLLYTNSSGVSAYSNETSYTQSAMITFYPSVATTTLTLSDTASYVITDYFGKEIKKGEGVEIYVRDLKPGAYYLQIQNRKEKFVKK